MKKLFLLTLGAGIAFACGVDQGTDRLPEQPTVNSMEVSAEALADHMEVEAVKTSTRGQVNRILSKKIDPETFEKDIELIEESGLYDSLVCKSFKNSQLLHMRNSSMSLTYKQALDATKRGIENGRRIERLNIESNL